MKNFILIAVLLCLISCTSIKHEISSPLNITIIDHPFEKKIFISFQNLTAKDICIDPGMWPNHLGQVDAASEYVYILIDKIRYPMKEYNLGYCPKCHLKVKANETVKSFVRYDDFNIPDKLFYSQKELQFKVFPSQCE